MSADIFASQPTDADLLAELYDLEHDQVTEDLVFYREQTRRSGVVLELGCGYRCGRIGKPAAPCRPPHRRGAAAGRGPRTGPIAPRPR
jgi:hypothetical protein